MIGQNLTARGSVAWRERGDSRWKGQDLVGPVWMLQPAIEGYLERAVDDEIAALEIKISVERNDA